MAWFYMDGGQRCGPIEDDEFAALRASGKLAGQTLVWRSGMEEWQSLDRLFPPPPPGGPVAFCSQCGRHIPATDLIAFGDARVCSTCKEPFFQRLREQGLDATRFVASVNTPLHYGGFWIRFVARAIDTFIVWVPLFAIAFATGVFGSNTPEPEATAVVLLMAGISIAYETYFLYRQAATPGKVIFALMVIRRNGEPLGFRWALRRTLANGLTSIVPFNVGYLIAAFDREKRALHDHLCGTRVIYKRG